MERSGRYLRRIGAAAHCLGGAGVCRRDGYAARPADRLQGGAGRQGVRSATRRHAAREGEATTMATGTFGTAINCMDGRVQTPIADWVKMHFSVTLVDMITEAGADGNL